MGFPTSFASSVILILTLHRSFVYSAPSASVRLNTHHVQIVGRGLEIRNFHPPSTFETFGAGGLDHPLSKRTTATLEESAIAFVESRFGFNSSVVNFKSGYQSETARHAYIKQSHNGIPIANAVANVAFNHDSDKVVAFGSSFVKPKKAASTTATITLEEAIGIAETSLDGSYIGNPSSMQYIAKEDDSLILTHSLQIRNEVAGTWYDAFVDAHNGKVVHVTDFVAKASYLVLPIHKQTLTEGFETLSDPYDRQASPFGWHSTGTHNYTTTTGNNALVYKDTTTESLTQPSSPELNFIYKHDPTAQPSMKTNIDAARTNAFYIVNTIHDIMYRYGFTEAAFNFQTNNFGKGGLGQDQVNVSVQSSGGMNNADFATPPDGQAPLMRMFLWDYVQPMRDGALENDIVVHENTHGMTNRMTGGGTAACLQTAEARGLGEGWSDAVAEWTESTSSAVPDYVMGQYVADWPPGVRSRPYSTSMTVNPITYSGLARRAEFHSIGEVWANILHNVYAALVNAHGWSSTAKTDSTGSKGNIVFLHLLIDALALQPCNPTFLNARDAWIQADANRYASANRCLLWKAFASRGMGVNAVAFVDSFSIPSDC